MSPLTFAHVSTSWWRTHSHSKKKKNQTVKFSFFLFIILPILETFLFVSGRFATVYFAACQNLKQSRTVSCVLLTEKGARSCTVHFPSNLLQIRIKHLKCKEISIAYLVYTSRLFNREGINYEFLFSPPSVGYIRRDKLHEDRGLREGHGTS